MSLADLDLCCFDDFSRVATRLHRIHLSHFFAAVLLDPTGRVIDLTVQADPWSDIHSAIERAGRVVSTDDRVSEFVLLSSIADPSRHHDIDLLVFRLTREGFEEIGVDLLDWLCTDGSAVTSIAERSGHDPWFRRDP